MSNKRDVGIYMRHIQLDVVIPERYVWEFMKDFGNEFAENDDEGFKTIKAVDDYYDHPGGWHIQVQVIEDDEPRFYVFLRKFCSERGLFFNETSSF